MHPKYQNKSLLSLIHYTFISCIQLSLKQLPKKGLSDQSMCQASVLLNNILTLTGPLLQHTASTCNFEDTEHLHSTLLLFCQQGTIEKHTIAVHVLVQKRELHLQPCLKLKICACNISVATAQVTLYIGQLDQYFCTFQSGSSINVKLQNNFALLNGVFIQRTLQLQYQTRFETCREAIHMV